MTMTQDLATPLRHPGLSPKTGRVESAHGSGGRAMHQLITGIFHKAFANPWLLEQDDFARLPVEPGHLIMSTDAYVVTPRIFPGGNIGTLAVHGTINDMAMSGAIPRYLTASFILEEGLALSELADIAQTMGEAASACNVPIVAGDTKVVERDKGDGIFITTTGIGFVPEGLIISGNRARPGDKVLLSGPVGDHAIAIMAARNTLGFATGLASDTAPLHDLVQQMLRASPDIRCLRDPTRGGVATTLNELARQSGVGFVIGECRIPVSDAVQGACELLGLDPLYLANEGKLIAICPPDAADRVLQAMHAHPLGQQAALIGEVVRDDDCLVQLNTTLGGTRLLDWLAGDQLPRIC